MNLGRSITLVSPTHAGDLARFAFQRETIVRTGTLVPHVAIVDHEDVPRFKDLPYQQGLTLVSTREVLSRSMEARRRARLHRQLHPWHWVQRLGIRRPLHGWTIQQLLKLAAPRVVAGDYVCLDSDTVLVRRVEAADFYDSDGQLYLFESSDDLDVEMAGWIAASMRFLGVKQTQQPIRRYTHAPVPMRRELVIDLLDFVEKRHGTDWMEAFARTSATEYATYGVYARHIASLDGVMPGRPEISAYLWWPESFESLEAVLPALLTNGTVKFAMMQSKRVDRIGAFESIVRERLGTDQVQPARAAQVAVGA